MGRPITERATQGDVEFLRGWVERWSAEEFAGRYGFGGMGCFSMHVRFYDDPELDAWMDRFYEIMWESPEDLKRCREQYGEPVDIGAMTDEEREALLNEF
jgi:hypothetical protein